jgi:hypothetical protein
MQGGLDGTSLLWSDGTDSGAGLDVPSPAWNYGQESRDPMYASFIYTGDSDGITINLTGLPSDTYDFYLYGHGHADVANSVFELSVGGESIGYKGTTIWGTAWATTNWEPGIQYALFRNVAVAGQTVHIHIPPLAYGGYAYINGLQIIPSASVPPGTPAIRTLINVNVGDNLPLKVGLAATGLSSGDYWNTWWDPGWPRVASASFPGLLDANLMPTQVGMVIQNAQGAWNTGLPDAMYGGYTYPYDGGNTSLIFTNLPDGAYDFYLYGHTGGEDDNGIFELWSGGRDYGLRGTSIWGEVPMTLNWEESQQYVVFRDVVVSHNEPVTILVCHDTYGYANVNGLQIVRTGLADANADGLPDAWKRYYFGDQPQSAFDDPDGDGLNNLAEFQMGTNPTKPDSDGNGVLDGLDTEVAWIEDALPKAGYGNDLSAYSSAWGGTTVESWDWRLWYQGDGWGGAPVWPHAGMYMHLSGLVPGAVHQHWFDKPICNIRVNPGDLLIAYVNLDSTYPPSEVMLQWYVTEADGTGSWEHRAYWGADLIGWGTANTPSRFPGGPLPSAASWARIQVPAAAVGLEGKVIQGMAFTLYGGRAAWDRAGKLVTDTSGLPTAWQLRYFGHVGVDPAADPDGDGQTNLQEFQNGMNPNEIKFVPEFSQDHLATTSASGTIVVLSGSPAQMALLVNSTDFASANWLPFNSSITVTLGPSDGRHEVRIGLRSGVTGDSPQVWSMMPLFLDRVPPPLTITSPLSLTTSQPVLQLKGSCPEPLSSLRFDLSNGSGTLLNQEGFVLDQHYDAAAHALTVNTFQCFDIPLTLGANTLTLRATDLAGNLTTTNITFTLDFSGDTTAPTVTLYWPQNGAHISGSAFTLRGKVDDPTSSITVTIGADPTIYTALVERSGLFWAENLPLYDGANDLTLTSSDAAGNVAMTALTVTKSDVTLTINSLPQSDLWKSRIAVNGTIDHANYTAWVNGVKATLGGEGTWSADNVPLNPEGTAIVQARAVPNTDNGGNGTGGGASPSYENPGNPSSAGARDAEQPTDKPMRIFVATDAQTDSGSDDVSYKTFYDDDDTLCTGTIEHPWNYSHHWSDRGGGTSHSYWKDKFHEECSGVVTEQIQECECDTSWPATEWPNLVDGIAECQYYCSPGTVVPPPDIELEHSEVDYHSPNETRTVYVSDGIFETETFTYTHSRSAQTTMKLFTGGKALRGDNLFVITASASEILTPRASPPYFGQIPPDNAVPLYPMSVIPPQEVSIGSEGNLGIDGRLYKVYPNGQTIDVTPKTSRSFYIFRVDASKHHLRITANDKECEAEYPPNTPTFIVGQYVIFKPLWDVEPPAALPPCYSWKFYGNYYNEHIYRCDDCSEDYKRDAYLLTTETPVNWWVSGNFDFPASYPVELKETITFQNGQTAKLWAYGGIQMYRPKAKISAKTSRVSVMAGWLIFADDVHDGITFSNSISIPPGFPGAEKWTQVLPSTSIVFKGPNGADYVRHQGGQAPFGDYPIPYLVRLPGTDIPVDSPGTPLHDWCVRLERSDSFRMFMMFEPPGGIPVPLRVVDWEWHGVATNGPSGWGLASSPDDHSTDPADKDTEDYPEWNSAVGNYFYTPPLPQ